MREHLSRELFRAISSGWRDPGDLARIAVGHLFELCPHCRREYEAWRREVPDEEAAPEYADYDAVIECIWARVEPAAQGAEAPIDSDVRQARSRAEELVRLGPEQQAEWIRTESGRHAGALLAEVLIEESRRRTPGYPRQGYTLADLARVVLQHAPITIHNAHLYARALGRLANAVRVIGDLPRADQILGDARYLLTAQGTGDRLLRAELDALQGSLRIGQGRPREAISLLLRALMSYRSECATAGTATTLIKLARTHGQLDDHAHSLTLLTQAEKSLEQSADPWLAFVIRGNAAWFLSHSGPVELAQQALEESEKLAGRRDDPINRLRLFWCRAKIAWRLQELDSASQLLLSVRNGFTGESLRYDVALASLDLGGVYLDLGRFGEAEELAGEALPVFEELGLPAKVAAARCLRARAAGA